MKKSWHDIINKYNDQASVTIPEILNLIDNKRLELSPNLNIFPPNENIFKAFEFCEINDIKVVIIGQDPYHSPNLATGLSFAINTGLKIPPSLRNIINELKSDIGVELTDTSLENWAKQGILMLNASLSVIQGQPSSQMKLWSAFTDYIISELNNLNNSIVFVAWGAFAHNKLKDRVDINKHRMIISSHPSPLSCYKKYGEYPSFKDSKPFSKINEFIQINW